MTGQPERRGKTRSMRQSKGDRAFDITVYAVLSLFTLLIVIPLWYCLVLSFNEGRDTMLGGVTLWPRKFTLSNYAEVFKEGTIARTFFVSVARTVVGTLFSLVLNLMLAYGLIQKKLMFQRFYTSLLVVTMFFSGGTIPVYMLFHQINLLNTFWVYILPMLSGFSTVLLYLAFLRELPVALFEAARIDGAREWQILIRLVIPLSAPLLATMALFAAVAQWNSWFDGWLYVKDDSLLTMSTYLVRLLNQAAAQELARSTSGQINASDLPVTGDSLKVATMFVTMLPITIVYPFVQKFFVKGIMLGAVKG